MKKSLYIKGMFMIFLILTLPFYISNVYAQTQLTVTRYSGDAGVNGFFDSYDRWLLETTASVEGDPEITPNQVRVNGYSMQNCSEISPAETYKCTYESAYYSLAGGTYTSTVELFSDDNSSLQSQEINMTMDNLPPIILFDRLPIQNRSAVSVAYTIKDQAWQENDFSICSGLSRVEFWDNGIKLDEQNITAPGCLYSATTTVPLPSTGNLIIKAYDKMDHIASKSSPPFELDTAPPDIQTDTFRMISQGVTLQEFIPSGSFPVNVQIKIIEDTSLQAKNVFADLSQFGESSAVPAAACPKIAGEYVCTWPALTLTIATGTYNIKISATDDAGNKQEATVVKSFTVDTTSPNIITVGTRNAWNSISYIGSNPIDIVAVVSDLGAGLAGRQAVLDLSEVDLAYAGKYFQANICEKVGANWECVWGPVLSNRPHGTRGNIYVTSMFDDAGNEAIGVKQSSIFIDRKPPEVQEIETNVYAEVIPITEIPTPVVSSGDDIRVSVQAKDDGEVKAFADFSRIMGTFGYENTPGSCTTEDNINWNCTWEVGPVGSGYLREDVFFTFVDSAGNNETVKQKVEVYAKSFEESPDYWTANIVDRMPNALDRSTTALIAQKMYFHLEFSSSTAAELVSAELAECAGDTGFTDNIFIFNNEAGSKDVFIGMNFKPFEATVDYLNITCTLNLLSTYRQKLTVNYEKEPVSLIVRFYDMPLGEAGESLREELEDEIDTWITNSFWQAISFLNNIFEWANLFCRMYYTYRQIQMVYWTITEVFATASKTIAAAPVTEPKRLGFCVKTEAVKEGTSQLANEFLDQFCGFINCKLGPLPEGKQPKGLENFNVVGGGGLLARRINEAYAKPGIGPSYKKALGVFQGTEDYRIATSSGSYLNVRDNIILSALTLCIPGIIYNLNKLRGIHCQYVSCVQDALDLGISHNTCREMRAYQECKFVYGAIFNFLPWTAFANYVLTLVKTVLSDPLSFAGLVMGWVCLKFCPEPGGISYKLCSFVKVMSDIGDILANIQSIMKPDAWTLANDPCVALEEEGVFEAEESEVPEGEAEEGEI